MKKIKKTLFYMAIFSLFFASCSDEQNESVDKLSSSNLEFEKSISNSKAVDLYTNDQETRLNVLGKQATSLQERASYFELEKLKLYLNNIEKNAKEKNIEVSGISFVFGADENMNRTIFLLPMRYESKKDYNVSFIIENDNVIDIDFTKEILNIKHTSSVNESVLSSKGCLSYNTAITWFNNYESNYIKPIKEQIKKEFYTKFAWYSIENVKNYINHIQKLSKKVNSQKVTGVNIFFGVHNKNETKPYRANTQTIFLVPSFENKMPVLFAKNEVTNFETILKQEKSITYKGEEDNSDNFAADEFNTMPPMQ